MTSHLQIAFPMAILWFSGIFTKFHTTFRVHNNKWHHFRDSALELGSWPPFPTIARALYPSGYIRAPANYAPTFRPHLHNMAHLGYTHIVSIAPFLAQFDGRTIDYTLETSRSMSTQRKLCTNKILNAKWYVSCLWSENKVVGIAKPLTKIYIATFHSVGHPGRDYPRNPPTFKLWGVRPGQPHRLRHHHAGEGAEWSALAHPACDTSPATRCEGPLRGEGRCVCPSGIPACAPRLVTKQLWVLSPHSWKFWPNFE